MKVQFLYAIALFNLLNILSCFQFQTILVKHWQCDNLSYKCQENETCCKSSNGKKGFICLSGSQLTCCGDDFGCPHNTQCIQGQKACRPLNFKISMKLNDDNIISPEYALSEPFLAKASTENARNTDSLAFLSLEGIQSDKLINTEQVLKGFLNTFPLTSKATVDNICIDNKAFNDELEYIINLLSDINLDSPDAKKILYQLVDRILEKKEIFKTESEECKKLETNLIPCFSKINETISKKDYFDKFALNLMGSLKKIYGITNNIKALYQDGKYYDVGVQLAGLIRLVFFWDL